MTSIKSKGRALSLKDVPEDVFEILINEQTRIKLDRGTGQFGLDRVIYRFIRTLNKLISMPRRPFNEDHMCFFARFVAEKCKGQVPTVELLRVMIPEWKQKHPDQYQEDKTMVTLLGKTPGDILGLKGPKSEPPSGN